VDYAKAAVDRPLRAYLPVTSLLWQAWVEIPVYKHSDKTHTQCAEGVALAVVTGTSGKTVSIDARWFLPPVGIEIKTAKIEMIRGSRLQEKTRFIAWETAETLPVPATGNLSHRHPVQFHAFLEILDYYVCHYRSPVTSADPIKVWDR
jgi:hypothetical protein